MADTNCATVWSHTLCNCALLHVDMMSLFVSTAAATVYKLCYIMCIC